MMTDGKHPRLTATIRTCVSLLITLAAVSCGKPAAGDYDCIVVAKDSQGKVLRTTQQTLGLTISGADDLSSSTNNVTGSAQSQGPAFAADKKESERVYVFRTTLSWLAELHTKVKVFGANFIGLVVDIEKHSKQTLGPLNIAHMFGFIDERDASLVGENAALLEQWPPDTSKRQVLLKILPDGMFEVGCYYQGDRFPTMKYLSGRLVQNPDNSSYSVTMYKTDPNANLALREIVYQPRRK